jgi:hypothetical protein
MPDCATATAEAVSGLNTEFQMTEYYTNELSSKRLFALWHSIGHSYSGAFQNLYYDLKKRFDADGIYVFNQYARTLFRDLRAVYGPQESQLVSKHRSRCALNGKTAYRVTGRATRAEERVLWNLDRGKRIAITKSGSSAEDYRDLKKRFDEDGWSAFDNNDTILFDELTAKFGGATIDKAVSGAFRDSTFDEGPVSQAERHKEMSRDKTHRVFDKIDNNFVLPRIRNRVPWIEYDSSSVYERVNDSNKSPLECAAIQKDWGERHKYVIESDIIPDKPAASASPRHTKHAGELQELLAYRKLVATTEPLQTNLLFGASDNKPDADTIVSAADQKQTDSEAEIRPTVNELMIATAGVEFMIDIDNKKMPVRDGVNIES